MRPENRSGVAGTSAIPGGRSPAAQARVQAVRVVERVRRGHTLEEALEHGLESLPPALHPLIQELAYGTVRWIEQLSALLNTLLDKPLDRKQQELETLLLIGLYQLLYMRVPPHAAVNETVAATVLLDRGWAKGLVNAVLRRAARELDRLREEIAADERLACAHPEWLLTRLKQAWPHDWRAIATANNVRPPLTLRVNLGRIRRAAYAGKLAHLGLSAHTLPEVDTALVLESPVGVEALPGFREGEVSVQDAAAQLAAPLLDAQTGMRVLDACAAPGGKAAHLLEHTPGIRLTALDIDPDRLRRVRENLTRLGLGAEVVAGDAGHPEAWWNGEPYDRILLDAPCSATGVIRRHPDIRLHRTPAAIDQAVTRQARLLDALWPLLAPGGKLLYVTCSILPEENSQQTAAFCRRQAAHTMPLSHPALARHAHFDGYGCQILTGRGEMDGFYYAGLVRPAAV
jgi:16S rRNA (cytosine967-C5)-methyltransferase